jgi:hypothetical protein
MQYGLGKHQADLAPQELEMQLKVSRQQLSDLRMTSTEHASLIAYMVLYPVHARKPGLHQMFDRSSISASLSLQVHAHHLPHYACVSRTMVSVGCPECNSNLHPGREILEPHIARSLL